MFQKWKMEDIFHLAIFANHAPTSKSAAYFQIAPCDFVFLLLLHQCFLLLFGCLSLVSLYEVGTGESMHSARQRRNGGEDKPRVIST